MSMPSPTAVKPIVTKRTQEHENMPAKELKAFMQKHGFGEKEFADLLGVTIQGVRLWVDGKREFSVTNSRLIRLFDKRPMLMKEF